MDASIRKPAPIVPTDAKANRRMAPVFWSAFAWLMIAALAGASIYGAIPFLRENGPTDPTMTAFQAGNATPGAANDTAVVDYGGDADRTWHLGEVEPATGAPDVMGTGTEGQVIGSPLIVSDSLFYASVDGEGLHYHRYDLDLAEIVWDSDSAIVGSAASDGDRLFGFVMRNPGTDASPPVPVAISIATGELVWEGPPLVLGSDASAAGPVLLGDIVYFSDALGNTVALDAASGAVAWQYPNTFAPRVTYGEADVMAGDPPDADMVATERGVFVERPSTTIVKLDPETGAELVSVNLIDDFGADIQQVGMQATADRLVISAARSEKMSLGADAPLPYRPTSILVFDTDSLGLVAKSGMPEIAGNMVLTDDAILLAGRTDLTASVGLYRIDQVSGDIGDPIHVFEAGPTGRSGLSASGRTVMMVDHGNQVTFIDPTSGATLASAMIDGDRGDLYSSPFQLWGERPVAVTSTGSVVIFGGNNAP